MRCAKCDTALQSNDCVGCSVCGRKYHYECSVRETKWRNMTADLKNKWACSLCKQLSTSSLSQSSSGSLGDLERGQMEDIASIKSLLVKVNERLNALDDVKSSVDTMHRSLEFLSSKYDDLLTEVQGFRADNASLRRELDEVKAINMEQEKSLYELGRRFNTLEQYGRGINLEIHGLEKKDKNESAGDVVKSVAAALLLRYNPDVIQAAHRIPPKNPARPPMMLIHLSARRGGTNG